MAAMSSRTASASSNHGPRPTSASPSPTSNTSAPSSSQSPKPHMRKFSHKFWAAELAMYRKIYLKALIGTMVLTIMVMWICLPVYWGSLAHQRSYPNKLGVYFINRDGSDVGNAIQSVVQATIQNKTHAKLGWTIVDASKYPSSEQVIHAVLDEQTWMAVYIPANTTTNLIAARTSGNASYDPTQAIQVYYAQGRNEQAAGNFLVPYSQQLLGQAATQFGAMYAKEFFTAQAGSGNPSALQAVAQAPQTVSTPVWYTMINLRPFSAPVATALLLVGSIYIIIFSFVVTMAGYAVRAPLEPFLTTRELLQLRLGAPLILYGVLSFCYSMVSLAFKVPFDAHFGYAGGFFLYWIFVYMTMASLGLATEFAIQFLTPRFMTFFLFPLIISNVSVASLPIQLEPWFYKYGYGFPVFNMSLATRTIIFDTKNHLGRCAGILVAWIVLSILTISAQTLWQRRNHKRAHALESGPLAGGVGVGAAADAEKAMKSGEKGTVVGGGPVNEDDEEEEEDEEERTRDDHDRMVGYMRGEKTDEQRADESRD